MGRSKEKQWRKTLTFYVTELVERMGGGIFMLEGKERIRACIGGLADFKTVTSGCTGFFYFLFIKYCRCRRGRREVGESAASGRVRARGSRRHRGSIKSECVTEWDHTLFSSPLLCLPPSLSHTLTRSPVAHIEPGRKEEPIYTCSCDKRNLPARFPHRQPCPRA